jgi:hypothetical protein
MHRSCEDVGICCRSIKPKCRGESEISGIGTNKDDGTISRNVFVVYTVGVKRSKEPKESDCSNRVYRKNNSLHQRLHNRRALNQSYAESNINMNPSPCNRMQSEDSHIKLTNSTSVLSTSPLSNDNQHIERLLQHPSSTEFLPFGGYP